MTLNSEPPIITSQMPWWEASLLLGILPVACWLFRGFARGPMAHAFHNRHALRVGIGIACLILGAGFISAGYALVGLLNYTRIEKEGIRQISFLKPEKFQRWDELVAADIVQKEAWEWGRRDSAKHTTGLNFEFKEGGRWREYMSISSDQFYGDDFQRLQDWLKAHLKFVPPPPSAFPASFYK